MKTTTAIAAAHATMKTGIILHAVDTDGCPITAGRVADGMGGEAQWSILRYPPPGRGYGSDPVVDNCGDANAVARVLVRSYLGAAVTMAAVERAG